MRFSSEKQRRAVFASFKNRFSREGLPGLGDALVGSIVGSWPGDGNDVGRVGSVSLNDNSGFHQISVEGVLDKPLNEQFRSAIEDKMGEAALYKNMAQKVEPEDAAQLNYMAEQQDWNKDALVGMAPRYTGVVVEGSADVTENSLQDYGGDFSNNPEGDDELASEFFDVDPDVLSERRRVKNEGKDPAPFVGRDKFIEDFKNIIGGDVTGSADEYYDIYLMSDAKNHEDFIKRIGIPTYEDMVYDSDIPSSYIRDEVSGVIPESQLQKVKDIVDTYEVDGGYVFIGSVDNVTKAEKYIR